MKKIIYSVTSNGVDGTERTSVLYAFYDEAERDTALTQDKGKVYRGVNESIVDIDKAIVSALAKLDGIDRLVLGLTSWPNKTNLR